jgi:hypothetical protein
MNIRPRIYVDTSVIGGCLDTEFQVPSLLLFERFKSGNATMVLSNLTLLELQQAPPEVRAILDEVPESSKEYVELTSEAYNLAERYISEGVVGGSQRVDAQHIAIATVNRVDVLVSWNFRHIVNLNRIHGFNSVNLRYGYPLLEIRTPWEAISYG